MTVLGQISPIRNIHQGQRWSDIIDYIVFGFLDLENHTLDTKMISLSFTQPEIIEHIHVLEAIFDFPRWRTYATLEEIPPTAIS